ncbi:somatostatin receptor type 5 [Scaptodrosophila lebanonensis]|uniref:Somatostatin receptor type 5 n=1 Tax=Drosophila lebanonensis TaxID=7225 RepID=A0A6J2TAU6_DROLE|nr:somatostatin receptor type 5 [Scaptodrosophila lebanonensis]
MWLWHSSITITTMLASIMSDSLAAATTIATAPATEMQHKQLYEYIDVTSSLSYYANETSGLDNSTFRPNNNRNGYLPNTTGSIALHPTDELLYTTDLPTYQHCIATRNSFADLFTVVLYGIVCIVGLFGNTLVIYVVLRFSKMQTVTNIYILNLAIADECFLIGIPFLLYTMRICSWRFGEFMCKAYMVSTSITSFTSSIFLLIMSADRYIAVCHPIASPRYRTLQIAKLVSAVAWSTSAVLMLPVILYASTVEQEDGINYSCNIMWPDAYKKHSGTTFILYTFFLGFATPLCFILCFYYLVIRKLQSVGPKHTTKSKEKRRAHRKVTRLVLTVITVYICCWLPHWMSQLALIHSNPAQRDLSRIEILIFLLLGCLVYSNSAVNPILYAFLSENFRKSFFKAFTCMNQQDINAQLQLEPSVFTKQGSRRRGGSRRFLAPNPQPPLQALNAGNNNSSTTTSSTTTAEKTGSTGAQKSCSSNGKLAVPATSENLIICLTEQQETFCTTARRGSGAMEQTDL